MTAALTARWGTAHAGFDFRPRLRHPGRIIHPSVADTNFVPW